MKNFELPSYEKWKANYYEYRKFIGSYCCAVVRDPSTHIDRHSYTLAVADNLIPERAGLGRVILNTFECDDVAEESLVEWYSSLQDFLNKKWEAFLVDTFLTEDYKELIQRNTPLRFAMECTCPVCGEELSSTLASFCCNCGQRIEWRF